MARRNVSARVALAVVCMLFLGGLAQLNWISLSSSYPSFSSLNPGPEGAKLLWDALQRTGKVNERRSYRPLEEAHFADCAVFYLNEPPFYLAMADEDFIRRAERIANDGNRLVIGIADDDLFLDDASLKEENKKNSFLAKRWNVWFAKTKTKDGMLVSVEAQAPWQVLHRIGYFPVFERQFGAGSIVLLPHVSRIANAALAKSEEARKMVPSLIGNKHAVVFDEEHLRIVESGSVVGLARRYRLHGLLIGLVTVAAFFLWNRSVAFPPVNEPENSIGLMAGNDARSTLVSLLSRHIPRENLMGICIAEWNRVRPEKTIAENAGADKDPVAAYRNIQESFQQKKTFKL